MKQKILGPFQFGTGAIHHCVSTTKDCISNSFTLKWVFLYISFLYKWHYLDKAIKGAILSFPDAPRQYIFPWSQKGELFYGSTNLNTCVIINLELVLTQYSVIPTHPKFSVHVEITQNLWRTPFKCCHTKIPWWPHLRTQHPS